MALRDLRKLRSDDWNFLLPQAAGLYHKNETEISVGILSYRYNSANTWGNTCEYR